MSLREVSYQVLGVIAFVCAIGLLAAISYSRTDGGIFEYRKQSSSKEYHATEKYCEAAERAFINELLARDDDEKKTTGKPTKQDYDSCQQWRSADSSLKQAHYAKWQGIAGAVATVASLLTLFVAVAAAVFAKRAAEYTGDAAIHAQDGTKAAWAAVKEAERSNTASLNLAERSAKAALQAVAISARDSRLRYKPWISVDLIGPFTTVDGTAQYALRSFEQNDVEPRYIPLHAWIKITCLGDMPATIESVSAHVDGSAVKSRGDVPAFVILQTREEVFINPADGLVRRPPAFIDGPPFPFSGFMLTRENRWAFKSEPPPVVGCVIYSDPLGVRYRRHFSFVASMKEFKNHGGPDANREEVLPSS